MEILCFCLYFGIKIWNSFKVVVEDVWFGFDYDFKYGWIIFKEVWCQNFDGGFWGFMMDCVDCLGEVFCVVVFDIVVVY